MSEEIDYPPSYAEVIGDIEFHNWNSFDEVRASRFFQKRMQSTYMIRGKLWTWNVRAESWHPH